MVMRAEDDRTLHPPDSSPTRVGTAGLRFEEGTPLGKYRVERPLGRGGKGRVLLARDTGRQPRVARKLRVADDGV